MNYEGGQFKKEPFLNHDLDTRLQLPLDPVSWRTLCRPCWAAWLFLLGGGGGLLGMLLFPKGHLLFWPVVALIFCFLVRKLVHGFFPLTPRSLLSICSFYLWGPYLPHTEMHDPLYLPCDSPDHLNFLTLTWNRLVWSGGTEAWGT